MTVLPLVECYEATTMNPSYELQARRLAEAVRTACLRAAHEAHEDAGVRGLCQEGRWEVALDAIRSIDLDRLLADLAAPLSPSDNAEMEG
jgi:hypothetical protein